MKTHIFIATLFLTGLSFGANTLLSEAARERWYDYYGLKVPVSIDTMQIPENYPSTFANINFNMPVERHDPTYANLLAYIVTNLLQNTIDIAYYPTFNIPVDEHYTDIELKATTNNFSLAGGQNASLVYMYTTCPNGHFERGVQYAYFGYNEHPKIYFLASVNQEIDTADLTDQRKVKFYAPAELKDEYKDEIPKSNIPGGLYYATSNSVADIMRAYTNANGQYIIPNIVLQVNPYDIWNCTNYNGRVGNFGINTDLIYSNKTIVAFDDIRKWCYKDNRNLRWCYTRFTAAGVQETDAAGNHIWYEIEPVWKKHMITYMPTEEDFDEERNWKEYNEKCVNGDYSGYVPYHQ